MSVDEYVNINNNDVSDNYDFYLSNWEKKFLEIPSPKMMTSRSRQRRTIFKWILRPKISREDFTDFLDDMKRFATANHQN